MVGAWDATEAQLAATEWRTGHSRQWWIAFQLFNFEVSSDRRDMSWSRGSLGALSSLTYITESMTSAAQTQDIVDITNGDQELSALNGIYIKQRDGTFGKVYTYYFRSGENPCMTFVDGYWQLCSRPRASWCFRRHGESGAPPGGEWELAPRLMKPHPVQQRQSSGSAWPKTSKGDSLDNGSSHFLSSESNQSCRVWEANYMVPDGAF